MATMLLVGDDAALLEGIAQRCATQGHTTSVAHSLTEARALAAELGPLVVVMDRALLRAPVDAAIPLAAGGAILLYHGADTPATLVPASLRRSILADLALPLEANRLFALVHRVEERARVVGRGRRNTPPETPAIR